MKKVYCHSPKHGFTVGKWYLVREYNTDYITIETESHHLTLKPSASYKNYFSTEREMKLKRVLELI
jgi:hypothetical protein